MKKYSGTVSRASVYEAGNGNENVALTIATNGGEKVAHIPWSRFQNAGIVIADQLVGTNVEVEFLSAGDPTLNGTPCTKDDTLVSSFTSEALITSAEQFADKITSSLADKRAEKVLTSMEDSAKARAQARLKRLAIAKGTASTPPAVTAEDDKAPELQMPKAD